MKPSQSHLNYFESTCRDLRARGFSIFGLHQDSIILAVTDDVERDFGYSVVEMLGMNAWKLFDVSSFTELTRHLIDKCDTAYQAVGIRKDGSRVGIYMNVLQAHIDDESVRLVSYKLI